MGASSPGLPGAELPTILPTHPLWSISQSRGPCSRIPGCQLLSPTPVGFLLHPNCLLPLELGGPFLFPHYHRQWPRRKATRVRDEVRSHVAAG